MAVATVVTWKVRTGRFADFMTPASEAKKILERVGGRVRAWQPIVGGEPGTVSFVVEHDDLAAYAEYSAKLQSDGEWQALIQKYVLANSDPTADIIRSALITEVPGL
jgi:hypothetical protein